MAFFQGRGSMFLRVLDSSLNPGPALLKLCTDSFNFKQTVQNWTHTNKCGAVDVEDARGITSQSAEVTFTFADVADAKFAFASLGTVNAISSPGTVTAETLPTGIVAGATTFLGNKQRHRAITALTIVQAGSPTATLSAVTDYTLDAASGAVLWLTTPTGQPLVAAYGYTDPAGVALFTASQNEYALDYEFINKQDSNNPGSLELYRVRFDPADNYDFQSDAAQILTLKGSCLADTARTADTIYGQFGRRVL